MTATESGNSEWFGASYVALGSSFAAGPGLSPRSEGRPRRARQSARNYPHLTAQAFGLRLTDVSSSGATTADLRTQDQFGQPPQLSAVTRETRLVTITVGGNDLGYLPKLLSASLPTWLTSAPGVGPLILGAFHTVSPVSDPRGRTAEVIAGVITDAARRAPAARIVCVDYLTILPSTYSDDLPMSEQAWAECRAMADDLAAGTAEAGASTRADLLAVSAASTHHHAYSAEPWTSSFSVPLPGRSHVPYHPTAAGMEAIARMLQDHLSPLPNL